MVTKTKPGPTLKTTEPEAKPELQQEVREATTVSVNGTAPEAAPVEAPKAARVIEVRELADETAPFRKGARGPSPLQPNVEKAVETTPKAYGVGIQADYPKSTIMTHLTRAAEDLGLKAKGLKLRTSDKSKDESWPHVVFSVVPIPAKPEAKTEVVAPETPATS